MIVLHHTRHPFVIAALFSGVGAGIALGNEYVIGGLHYALSAHSLWLGPGARRYIAINRGNIDSPALMRCRLRP